MDDNLSVETVIDKKILSYEPYIETDDMITATKTDTTDTLKEQLELIYEGDPWYGDSIASVLNSVYPNLIFDSPGPGMHSIAELAAHMITYRNFAEDRLQGNTESPPDQEKTFDWRTFTPDKKSAWNTLRARLDSSQQNLLNLLNQNDDSVLDQKVAGKPYTFHYLLTGILQHDLYHLGQIVYINKLLGKNKINRKGRFNYDFNLFSFENLAQLK